VRRGLAIPFPSGAGAGGLGAEGGLPDASADADGDGSPDAAARADAAAKSKPARAVPSLAPGDRVVHDSFGMGTVVALDGVGDKSVASIDFGSEGVKRLLLRYAPVEKL